MVTMHDIVRLTGYSRSTVSAVLRGKDSVSPKARQRVLQVVEDLHYEPSLIARALVGKTSSLIGVVVRDLANPYYSKFISGLQAVFAATDYDLLVFDTQESHEREVKVMQRLGAYQVAGIIISPVLRGVDLRHITRFSDHFPDTPLISLEGMGELPLDLVAFKDEEGGVLATRHLLQMGHRRIAYLAGPATSEASEQRRAGFMRCLQRNPRARRESRVVPCGATSEAGCRVALDLLLSQSERPTALFCFNDLVAIGVYQACHQLGIRIPQELSVVGYDDIDLAAVMGPPLTSISFSMRDVGLGVGRQMLAQIQHRESRAGYRQWVSPRLIQRASVGAID